MKIFTAFSITFILMACLFAGCSSDEEDDDLIGPGGMEEGLGFFATMNAGSWAEHSSPEGDRDISKFLGEDTWQGRASFLMEFESESDGGVSATQIWIDKATAEVVLFLIKMDGEVIKMDLSFSETPDVPGEEVPWEGSDAEQIGTGTYTTPTGRTVDVTKHQVSTFFGTDEFWVSTEVPFGEVKEISDGEVVRELYDFGLSGAKRIISKEEAENAEPFAIPDIPNIPIIPNKLGIR